MKNKRFTILFAIVFMVSILLAFPAIGEEAGATVVENPEVNTGYTATFTYINENATNVRISGSFYFYTAGDENLMGQNYNLQEGENYLDYAIRPEQWEKGKNLYHVFDEKCVYDMENIGDGVWTISLNLPAGYYTYHYQVSYNDGKSYETIIDPANRARLASMNLTERRSEIYVPFNAELHDPWLNMDYATPLAPEQSGTCYHFTYKGVDGLIRPGMIYLPVGYDPDRAEPYKVLYACHGGAGNEQDFFLQWHGDYITDNAIAEGIVEPFIVVTMNNKDIGWSDYDKLYDNQMNYLIPYVEEHYNVSKDPADRAFCGLSMGGMTTSTYLCKDPTQFGYYGIFSGANCSAFPELDDYSDFQNAHIYLGCGYCDNAYIAADLSSKIVGFAQVLDEHGIEYNNGDGYKVVNGGHDWYTWDQLLRDFYVTTLWK